MEKYGLTYPQKNIWLTEKFNDNNAVNNIVCSVEINEKFDEKLCNEAINYTILKNDALRFKIIEENADAYQVVEPFEKSTFKVVDFSNKSKSEVTKYKEKFAKEAIDPKEKLCKFEILKYSQNSGAIIMKTHHLISDAWSCSKIGSMLIEYIDKKSKNEEIDDTTPSPSYIEYIKSEEEYTSSEKYKKDEEFWNEYLKDIKEPVALKASTNISDKKAKRYSVTLTKKESEKINKYCKENKISPYVLFLTALSTYMYRITEHDDFIIGTPVLNRANFKEKNMIGMFVSTIPLRVKVEEGTKFIDLAKAISSDTFSMFRHQKYPYSKILENIHKNTEIKNNLYNVVLSYQNARADIVDSNLYETKWIFSGSVSDQLQIHLLDMNSTGLFNINYDYIESLFSSIEMKYIHTRLMAIIFDAIENDNVDVENIRIMSKEEEHKILYEFNDTERDYPKDKTVIQLFEEQVEKTPDNIALVFEDEAMTYKELNEKANQLAHYLREEKGVRENDFIGILIDKSIELIVAIIAVLKNGACYVPLEKSHLLERKKFILKNSNCNLLIVEKRENIDIEQVNVHKINNIDNDNLKIEFKNYSSDSPNCVLYTSGTTGEPKGAIIVNRNIVKLVKNADYIEFKPTDKLLQAASTSFDVSLFEIWGSLLNGACLHIIRKENLINPVYLEKYLLMYEITVLWITSALFNQMVEFEPRMFCKLRRLFTGGDVISKNHVEKLLLACPNLQVTNCYGPTECTTFTNTYDIKEINNLKIPIGKTISNTKGYVIDKNMRLLPLGCEGEYVLAGESVALGYINKAELTKQKFIKNIFPNNFSCQRMYKTGDIVLMLFDGNIQFVGRRDNQVKIRGFRIELDEIRNCFMKIDGIDDCVVIVKDTEMGKKIFAYYTTKKRLEEDKINSYLKANLLSYLVPFGIMKIEKMPINANGKIDRRALPDILVKNNVNMSRALTCTEKEIIKLINDMYDIKCDVLQNLFETGIDSLALIKLITKLQLNYNVNINVSDIFNYPTVEKIAALIDENRQLTKSKNVISTKNNILSVQQGIFTKYMVDPNSTLYNIPFYFTLDKNKVDVKNLKCAIETSIKNHGELFSNFALVNGIPCQKWNDIDENYEVKLIKIEEDKVEEYINNFAKPFDLLYDLLFKIEIIVTEYKVYVIFNLHHIVFDGVSMMILLNEITTLYNGKNIVKEKKFFKEYVQNNQILEEDLKYFKKMLENELPINDMPYDFPRGKSMDNRGQKLSFSIKSKFANSIMKYAKENNYTMNSIMQSAFIIVLSKYMYNEDILIGIADSGRKDIELQNTVGMLVKTLPYREKLDWDNKINDFIEETQKKTLNTIFHDSVTYEDIIKEIDYTRYNNRTPLFDIMFICQSMYQNNFYINDQRIEINEIPLKNSKFDMSFEVVPDESNIKLNVEYRTSLFKSDTIKRFVKNYINVLEYIINNPNKKLCDIDMISDQEKSKVLNEFNNTKTTYPSSKCIHEIFEETAKGYSDKIAVVFKDEKISYLELNQKANKLARLLINKGVNVGDVVGVLIDKSSEYMIALLGILKAGAAYMPISKDMPDERVKYVLQDANANYLVTTEVFDRNIDKVEKIYVNIKDEKSDYFDINNDNNLNLKLNSTNKAYVMYTSGTTGNPKGITIVHKGITRLLLNTNLVNFNSNDSMLVSGSVTFDTSGFEIWGAMFYGMTLHFIDKKDILTPMNYERYLKENNITTTLIPTPIFNQLVEYNPYMFKNITKLYVCGDVLLNKYSNQVIRHCKNTKLFNTYGPTENSVISTFEYVNKITNKDISIGKNISNNVSYVVDKCGKLCPIGVPGELYVGGDGLGLGYINKPETTRDKFVYFNEINKPVYRTGDLTSFYSDGKIKFMGRIDTQIKLRGQRIEILEIQNKILEIPNIKECVVMLKENKGNKYLVAYYTCNLQVDPNQIKKYIAKFLPSYMIPYKFIEIAQMPLNQNSKIDRKRLPDINFEDSKILMPENDLQKSILDAYTYVLNDDNIGMSSNFFEFGGDSLLAMKLVGRLEETGIHINYSDVFEYTTPIELYNKVNRLNNEKKIDIENYDYSEINKIIKVKDEKVSTVSKVGNVLLTGVTGFLGAHILDSLINRDNDIKVYCLAREKDGINPKLRVKNTLEYYFGSKYNKSFEKNIIVLNGDITSKYLIESSKYREEVIKDVNLVINAAAHVKHFGNKKIFEEINVNGAQNVCDFCIRNNKKLIHISTLSVSGNLLEGGQISQAHIRPNTIFDESNLYIGQNLNNIYALTKFIAERNILTRVAKKELNAKIIRVGNLTGRYMDGKFQINQEENAFLNRIKTFKKLGVIPEDMKEFDVEFSPVDLTADFIVNLAFSDSKQVIYHIYNVNHIKLNKIVEILNSLGFNLRYISNKDMNTMIKGMLNNDETQDIIYGIIQDLNEDKELKYKSNIKIKGINTVNELAKINSKWPDIDREYLIKFFKNTGVID